MTVNFLRSALLPTLLVIVCAVASAQTMTPRPTPNRTAAPSPTRTLIPLQEDGSLHLTKSWDRPLSGTLSQATDFCVFRLNLYLAANDATAGPQLWALPMKSDNASGPATAVSLAGIPSQFRISAIGANPMLNQFFIAGNENGAATIYQGQQITGGSFGDWKKLPPFPEQTPPAFKDIHEDGEFTFFLTASDETAEGHFTGGWAANTGAGAEQFQWRKIPAPKSLRKGSSVFVVGDSVIQAGGIRGENDEPDMESITFDKKNFGAWQPGYIPLARVVQDSIGAGEGSSMFIASREAPKHEGPSEPPRAYFSTALNAKNFSLWNSVFLPFVDEPLRAMAIDPGHNRLLLITEGAEGKDPLLTAYELPAYVSAHRKTDAELKLINEAKAAANPPRVSPAEALAEARKKETAALMIVSTGEKEEDIHTRVQLRSNQFRYATRGAVITYLTGAEGAALLRQYDISGTPAYLLIDKDGKLLSHISGRVPSTQDMFELTKPLRAPAGEATPTPAP